MPLKEDITNKINEYFKASYSTKETNEVPDLADKDLTYGNTGLVANLVFLFVDIRNSSKLHADYGYADAARIYQSFHDINVRVISEFGGEIRAFDGDRVMGVFAGGSKNSNATKSALKIQYGIQEILNPSLVAKQKKKIGVGIGIAGGKTLITKVGKGWNFNNNDLVWVGQACNWASHLAQEADNTILITEGVYNSLSPETKFSGEKNMWTSHTLSLKDSSTINVYQSAYHWGL